MTCRVLIVEDEPLIAASLAAMLTDRGLTVCGQARSAAEALALATAEKPDIVFMDVQLDGGKDGIEAAKPLVARFGCGIVFITAHADVPTRVLIRSFVPTAEVLAKPVEWSEIEAACARVKPNGGARA